MEGDSQKEDETLRNYWTKKKEKKKEREKKKRERRSAVPRGKLRAKTKRHKTSLTAACLTPLSSPPSPLLTRELFTPHSLQRKSTPPHITT
jgi:hypothetical protein